MKANSGRKRRTSNEVVLILSQDTGGVLQYLTQMFQNNSSEGGITVLVRGVGVSSKTMVQVARASLAGSDTADVPAAAYVFLVFDRDSDPHFDTVMAHVNATERMEAIPSIPCFEYFFILHHEEIRPAMAGPGDALSLLRRYEGFSRYEKGKNSVPVAKLSDQTEEARARCQRIRAACAADGAKGPLTLVDQLFSAMETARAGGIAALIDSKPERLFR